MLAKEIRSAQNPVLCDEGKKANHFEDHHVARLFREHRHFVYQQAWRITRSGYHAEEIVQEVFMRVWIHRQKLSAIKDMNSWLFIITKRLAFDYFIRLSKERSALGNFPRTGSAAISDAFFTRQCEDLLAEATQQLTPRLREAFELKYYRYCKKEDVARIMDISICTATHHIKKSASLVRKYIFDKLEMAA